jgi:hypothetical protein
MFRDEFEKKNKSIKKMTRNKRITIKKMRIKFDKKNQRNQMTRYEIKNKIQLEIINVIKIIAIKRKGTESTEKGN